MTQIECPHCTYLNDESASICRLCGHYLNPLEEEVLDRYPEETFVTYRNCRIFYKFKEQVQEWFGIVYLTGREAAQPGCSSLGCDWFGSKDEAIQWGIGKVDEYRQGANKF